MATVKAGKKLLNLVFRLAGCGRSDEREWVYVQWECLIAEQSDYFDGTNYHRFFRGSLDAVGYASSNNGVDFTKYEGNPILDDAVYPVLALDGDNNRYLIVPHRKGVYGHYLYGVNDPSTPVILLFRQLNRATWHVRDRHGMQSFVDSRRRGNDRIEVFCCRSNNMWYMFRG